MSTTTFSLEDVGGDRTIVDASLGSAFSPSIAAGADGNVFMTFSAGLGSDVDGAILRADGTLLTKPVAATVNTDGVQFGSETTRLESGNFVTVYDGNGGIPHIQLTGPGGAKIKADFAIPNDGHAATDPHVSTLADGGFVVTWTKDFTGNDLDIRAQMYNADGSLRGAVISVESSGSVSASQSTVAGLADGGFVTMWSENPIAGGADKLVFQRYDAHGAPIGGPNPFDTFGSVNTEPKVVALADGGFAVAYTDDGWDTPSSNDITLAIFNADGTQRTEFIRANADSLTAVNGGDTSGAQSDPSITVLSNGAIAVSWTTGQLFDGAIKGRVFDPKTGEALTGITDLSTASDNDGHTSLAGLRDGGLGVAYDTSPETGAAHVHYHAFGLVRTTKGDATSETMKGDNLVDKIYGGAGDDTLSALGGNDTLSGGSGNDVLDGGKGADAMVGGADNDVFFVDTAKDKVIEAAGQGTDKIAASVSYALQAGQSVEQLQTTLTKGTDAIDLTGNEIAQKIFGNAGANVIDGGLGNDALFGGLGNDTFVFKTTLGIANIDHITDFSAAADTMRLDDSVFKGLALGELRAGAFKDFGVAGAKVDADDRILYDHNNGKLFFDADGSGVGKAVHFATLDNHALLTAHDFFIV